MSTLNISLVQADLVWQQPGKNREHLQGLLESIAGPTDLVVLPEMFSTGFTMEAADWAEPMDGPTVGWMQARAAQLDAALCGSLIIAEGGHFVNRFLVVEPGGRIHHYDKRHLFTMAGEDRSFTPGQRRVVLNYRGWRICPLVCYDLRFPVWSRNDSDYDLLLYVANWPSRRRHHWTLLSRARAVENQCYVAAVNRVGTDAKGLDYLGDSTLVDFSGDVLWSCEGQEQVYTGQLDRDALQAYRQRFPFLADRDRFEVDSGG